MNRVSECKEALLKAILESPEYAAFEQAKEEVAGDGQLRERIDEFRRRVYIMQNTNDSINRLDDMKDLFLYREQVHMDERAARYLDAEAAYIHLVRDICLDVMSLSDIELDPIADQIDV